MLGKIIHFVVSNESNVLNPVCVRKVGVGNIHTHILDFFIFNPNLGTLFTKKGLKLDL